MKKYIFAAVAIVLISVVAYTSFDFNQKHYNLFLEADLNQLTQLIETEDQTIVYYGSETCSDCVKFAPILKKQFDVVGLKVQYVNSDNMTYSGFVKSNNLDTTPSLVVFKKGKEIVRYSGFDVYDGMTNLYNNVGE